MSLLIKLTITTFFLIIIILMIKNALHTHTHTFPITHISHTCTHIHTHTHTHIHTYIHTHTHTHKWSEVQQLQQNTKTQLKCEQTTGNPALKPNKAASNTASPMAEQSVNTHTNAYHIIIIIIIIIKTHKHITHNT